MHLAMSRPVRIVRLFLSLFLFAFITHSAVGQDEVESPIVSSDTLDVGKNVFVSIATNAGDALLFADSVLIGPVTSGFIGVPSSTRRLRVAVRNANTWSVPPIERRLDARPGDSVEVHLQFPYHYRIESVPFGARVHVERGEEWDNLGTTPLFYTSETPLDGRIVIERPGYAIERVAPGGDVWNRHVVMLKPSDELDPTAAQVDWHPPKQRSVWIDYAALGTAVVAGVVAVHYKFKADDLYSTYEETADPALRDDIHAHDVRSGVALGVMQAGLGIFALRLVLR